MKLDFDNGDNHIEQLASSFESMLSSENMRYFDVEEFEDLIDYYITHFEVNKAIIVTEVAINQHPQSLKFKVLKARAQLLSGEFMRAFETINNIVGGNSDFEVLLLKGEVYLKMGKPLFAERFFQKSLEYSGELFPEVSLEIAVQYSSLQKYKLALSYLRKAYEADSQNKDILQELAFCYEQLNNQTMAIKYYNLLLDLDPYDEESWFSKGLNALMVRDYELAKSAFEFCIAINNENEFAWMNMGLMYSKTGQWTEAISCYEKYGEVSGKEQQAAFFIGECLEESENLSEALKYYNKAIDIDSMFDDAWVGRGYVLYERGDFENSIMSFKTALNLNNSNLDAWVGLGDCYATFRLTSEGISAYDKALEIDDENEDVWVSLTSLLIESGDIDSAYLKLQNAKKLITESADLKYNMAICNYNKGNIEEAVKNLAFIAGMDNEYYQKWITMFPETEVNAKMLSALKRIIVKPEHN